MNELQPDTFSNKTLNELTRFPEKSETILEKKVILPVYEF